MAEDKRYYWLKLNDDFFEDDTISWIEEQESGKDYVLFYLKLCLKSLRTEGSLIRNVGERLIPYNVNALSRLTNTQIDTVKVAMKLFSDIGLVTIFDTGEIFLNQINEMIGTETDSAKRKRRQRSKEALLENMDNVTNSSDELPPNRDNVPGNSDSFQKSPAEIEIELEKDIEIDIELESEIEKPNGGDVHLLFQQNFGMPTPIIMQDLEHWITDLNEELVILALKKAAFTGAPYKYAQTTMRNWASKGIKTIAEAEAESVGHQKQKQWNKQPKKEVTPDWVDEPRNATETPVAPDVAESIAERIAKLKSSGKNVG